jgi:hypothetical protein
MIPKLLSTLYSAHSSRRSAIRLDSTPRLSASLEEIDIFNIR